MEILFRKVSIATLDLKIEQQKEMMEKAKMKYEKEKETLANTMSECRKAIFLCCLKYSNRIHGQDKDNKKSLILRRLSRININYASKEYGDNF